MSITYFDEPQSQSILADARKKLWYDVGTHISFRTIKVGKLERLLACYDTAYVIAVGR